MSCAAVINLFAPNLIQVSKLFLLLMLLIYSLS